MVRPFYQVIMQSQIATEQQTQFQPSNAQQLERDLLWLEQVIHVRMALYFGQETERTSIFELPPPDLQEGSSIYAHFIRHYEMNVAERLIFLLALAPHLKPQLLDVFFQANETLRRGFTEFGGIKGQLHAGFIPTIETAMFLLGGDELAVRVQLEYLFERDHFFTSHNILRLENPPHLEPRNAVPLTLSYEVIDMVLHGQVKRPQFSKEFPARILQTALAWDHLILSPQTQEQLKELQAWVQHEKELMNDWDLAHAIKPGYKSLFYGPPGTGKTLTATLLGKKFQKDVYRIDLSTVISKYIGETEKNLENIFVRISYTDAILFFDEADALFGKRTSVNEAHDRYANQEVSYLLQRIEEYSGLVILASNFKSNIDEAFLRRFQSIVHFPMPDSQERYKLWEQAFSSKFKLGEKVDLQEIASQNKLAGGSIINVVRYASLMAISRQSDTILLKDILTGIRRELQKEGKTS